MQSRRCVSSRQRRFWLETRVAKPSPQVAEQALHSVPHSWHGYRGTGDTAPAAAREDSRGKGWLEAGAVPCDAEGTALRVSVSC